MCECVCECVCNRYMIKFNVTRISFRVDPLPVQETKELLVLILTQHILMQATVGISGEIKVEKL